MIPQAGESFRFPHERRRFRCLEVRADCVVAYGGSTDPGGHQSYRTFPLTAPFVIVALKDRADA